MAGCDVDQDNERRGVITQECRDPSLDTLYSRHLVSLENWHRHTIVSHGPHMEEL